MAIVGIDDEPEAQRVGLTSYNFNIGTLVQAMVRFVAYEGRRRRTGPDERIEIEGFLMERASSIKRQ